jgi:predicted RNA-binding Zn-ribbon protein involved in translation (DUF1610 family)
MIADFDFGGDFTPHYAVIDKDTYNNADEVYKDDIITLAFHKGKVMTMEEYVKYHNEGKDTNDHIEKVDLYDTCWEMCPECEEEVMLETKFRMQVCPNCGKPIAPCNLCGGNCVTPCPLGCN